MRKDAKYGLAIGAAIVAVAAPWIIIAKHPARQPAPWPKLLATAPATQPAETIAVAARYYRDHAGNLFQRSGGAPVLVAPSGAFVTCPIPHGRAYAILDNMVGRATSVTILRCAGNGSLLSRIRVTDDDLDLVTGLDSLIFLPTGRFFIEAELNPSNNIGIDAGLSDHHCFVGCDFTWNAAGKSVAYFWNPPGAPPDIPSEIFINDRVFRDIPQGTGEKLRWESDGRTLDVKARNAPRFRINSRTGPSLP